MLESRPCEKAMELPLQHLQHSRAMSDEVLQMIRAFILDKPEDLRKCPHPLAQVFKNAVTEEGDGSLSAVFSRSERMMRCERCERPNVIRLATERSWMIGNPEPPATTVLWRYLFHPGAFGSVTVKETVTRHVNCSTCEFSDTSTRYGHIHIATRGL